MSHERKELALNLLFVFALCIVIQTLEFYGWFQSSEDKVMDFLLNAISTHNPAVVTLEIDDQSFDRCFDKSSPLKPRVLLQTVKMVDKTDAAAVGIDVLTDNDSYWEAHLDEWKKEVWIADSPSERESLSFWEWIRGRTTELTVHPDKVFGKKPPRDPSSWGIPVFPADDDAAIRRTWQRVRRDEAGASQFMPTWAFTIAARYCGVSQSCNGNESSKKGRQSEPLFVAYGGQPIDRFQFRDVFRCPAASAPATASSSCEASSLKRDCLAPLADGALAGVFREKVKDKVVLIGGAYRAARDTYKTPLGLLPGVAINGYVVRSQIQGNFLQERYRPLVVVLDFWASCMLVLMPFVKRTVPKIGAAVLFGTSVGLVSLLGLQYLAGCGALIFGTMMHLLHEKVKDDEDVENQKREFVFIFIPRRLPPWLQIPRRSRTRRRNHSAP